MSSRAALNGQSWGPSGPRLPWRIALMGLGLGCGSRAEPSPEPLLRPLARLDAGTACLSDIDCLTDDLCAPGQCVEGVCRSRDVQCDDEDACTRDSCDAETGRCQYEALTADRDGDGHRVPLAGMLAGAAGACGDDCDDARAAAHPGGVEVCDGVDNDCDGLVDNGAVFTPTQPEPIQLSSAAGPGAPGGIAFGDEAYGVVYSFRDTTTRMRFQRIATSQPLGPSVAVTEVNSDTFAGPLLWTGRAFATTWEDRRDRDYEIYFNRLDAQGDKLGADIRITEAAGFSLRPTLGFGADEFLIAWEDERDDLTRSRIFAQRVTYEGQLIGANQPLTPLDRTSINPALAFGRDRVGLTYLQQQGTGLAVVFQSLPLPASQLVTPFTPDIQSSTEVSLSGTDAAGQSITAHDGGFVVAWHTEGGSGPGPQILGVRLSEQGDILSPITPLTQGAEFARWHALLPLADRLLLFWSESRAGVYNVHARELRGNLEPLTEAAPVTAFSGGAYGPLAAFGSSGEIGVVFTAVGEGTSTPQAYFIGLTCGADTASSSPPPSELR